MPLSPTDVVYLNKLLDRHLKAQRALPWVRYCRLAGATLLLTIGAITWMQASRIGAATDSLMTFTTSSAHRTEPSATKPVTEAQMLKLMESDDEMLKGYAKFAATMAILQAGLYGFAMVQWYFGVMLAFLTLAKWNHHRRDTILITLLREKCAAELAMPAAPSV